MLLRLILVSLLAAFAAKADAQWGGGVQRLMSNKRPDVYQRCPRIYAGLASGINAAAGLLGAQIDAAVTQQVSVCVGFGRGTWGWKGSLEGRYYFTPCNRGLALALGGAYAAGGTEITVADAGSATGTRSFVQRAAFLAQVSAIYFVSLGRTGNRAQLQAGYSLPLNADGLRADGSFIPSRARSIELQPPGGPMIAVGLSLGIGHF